MNAACPDLGCKQRTKTVPPIPYRLMTHVDTPFVKQVLDLPQGEWKSNLQHHRKTDDLGRCLEVFEMVFHSETLDGILPTLNAVSSDNALVRNALPRVRRVNVAELSAENIERQTNALM